MNNLLLLLVLFASNPARAATELPSGEFLNGPLDLRHLGMGEAGIAVAEGAGAVSVNPSALHAVKAHHAYFTHGFQVSGVGTDYLSYGLTLGRHHMGFSYHHVGYGSLLGVDDAGNQSVNFTPGDTAYGFAYGAPLWGAELGVMFKYVESKIIESAHSLSWDLGGQYRLGESWAFGLTGRNLGGDLRYEKLNGPLPTVVTAGLGWRPQERWWVTLDMAHPVYSPSYVALGGEYVWPVAEGATLAVRLGANTKTPELGAWGGVKVGLGFMFNGLDLDYALNPAGSLGQGHHMAVGWRFTWPGWERK